ncbi:MAG: hypothetical protein ACI8RZ_003996 [Myxococcota bacterium]|jgi:hypothetical protein
MLALFSLLIRPAAASPITLEISALIDGSDVLRLDATGAWWSHRHWGMPKEVEINSLAWDPIQQPHLPNDGATRFLPPHVEFDDACVLHRSGRDTLSVERNDDHILIAFADTPNSADHYSLTLVFDGDCTEAAPHRR